MSTFSARPPAIKCCAVSSAYTKPEHAADRSKQKAFFAPICPCTTHDMEGKKKSGVAVVPIIISISSGGTCADSSARSAAIMPIFQVGISLILRSFIPVWLIIHSSEVSTIWLRASLSSICSGRYEPTPTIFALRDITPCKFNFCVIYLKYFDNQTKMKHSILAQKCQVIFVK